MVCPNDSTEMRQVRIVAHYGQPIIVDQCQTCGGIWFDESELFGARQGEAEKIEALDPDILQTPSMTDDSKLFCPRDKTEMHRFSERHFPPDIILVRCLSCHGIWLNRGVFTSYQRFRQELMRPKDKSPEDRRLETSINELVEAYRAGHSSETLKNLGQFLSTPVGGSPLDWSGYPRGTTSADGAAGAALHILMALLRAFIFRR